MFFCVWCSIYLLVTCFSLVIIGWFWLDFIDAGLWFIDSLDITGGLGW